MATYTAINFFNPAPTAPLSGVLLAREFLFTVSVALVINDIIKLAPIPAGVVLDDWYIDVPDLDTGTAIVLAVGDATTAAKFATALTTGQAGGRITQVSSGVAASLPVEYEAASDFRVTVSTGPTTGTTAVVFRGRIMYHTVGNPSPV